jgi:hypothetical protein
MTALASHRWFLRYRTPPLGGAERHVIVLPRIAAEAVRSHFDLSAAAPAADEHEATGAGEEIRGRAAAKAGTVQHE